MRMTTAITIYPESSPSPYQRTRPQAPQMVNEDFFQSFADVLDVVNPLQHISGVSTIYRSLTDDKIGDGAQLLGGLLFGGPFGLVASIANLIFEQETGRTIAGNVYAAVTGNYEKTAALMNAAQTAPGQS